jgi:NAD(P) transhydrogenase subunit alpha
MVPAAVKTLQRMGLELLVQSGAGTAAGFPDPAYDAVGASLAPDRDTVLQRAEIIVAVRADPAAGSLPLRPGQVCIAQCDPLGSPQHAVTMAGSGASIFALELVPRITRAQAMDVLSSMATITGYKSVLIAAGGRPAPAGVPDADDGSRHAEAGAGAGAGGRCCRIAGDRDRAPAGSDRPGL